MVHMRIYGMILKPRPFKKVRMILKRGVWGLPDEDHAKKCYIMSINSKTHFYELDSHILQQALEKTLPKYNALRRLEVEFPY